MKENNFESLRKYYKNYFDINKIENDKDIVFNDFLKLVFNKNLLPKQYLFTKSDLFFRKEIDGKIVFSFAPMDYKEQEQKGLMFYRAEVDLFNIEGSKICETQSSGLKDGLADLTLRKTIYDNDANQILMQEIVYGHDFNPDSFDQTFSFNQLENCVVPYYQVLPQKKQDVERVGQTQISRFYLGETYTKIENTLEDRIFKRQDYAQVAGGQEQNV